LITSQLLITGHSDKKLSTALEVELSRKTGALKVYHQFTVPYNNNYLLNFNIKPIL